MITIKHFTASWCAPCKQLSPIIKDLVNEIGSIGYQIIDVDLDPQTASKIGIRGIPTVILEKNGIEVQRIVGLKPKSFYKELINNL